MNPLSLLKLAKENWEAIASVVLIAAFSYWLYDLGYDRAAAKHAGYVQEAEQLVKDYKAELEESDRMREIEFAERNMLRQQQRKDSREPVNEYRESSPAKSGGIGDDGLRLIEAAIECRRAKGSCRGDEAVPKAGAAEKPK